MADRLATSVGFLIVALSLTGCLLKAVPLAEMSAQEEVEAAPATLVEADGKPDSGLLATLKDLAVRNGFGPKGDQELKPLINESAGVTKNMCKGGKCPNGYRCGSAPGRPRKVCYATGKHRAKSSSMFERTVP